MALRHLLRGDWVTGRRGDTEICVAPVSASPCLPVTRSPPSPPCPSEGHAYRLHYFCQHRFGLFAAAHR